MRRLELTGQKFNKLTVIEFAGILDGKYSYWKCSCDCGKEKLLRGSIIVNGHQKSCGCSQYLNKHHLINGESSFNYMFSNYKRKAKSRNKPFKLTKEQFRNITKQLCHYCNSKPRKFKAFSYSYGYLLANGVDRVDNNLGYTLDNSVPCCKICNLMKLEMSKDGFLYHVKTIFMVNFNK